MSSQATTMDLREITDSLIHYRDQAITEFHKVPGSAILIRYIKTNYQNDPVRSAIELCLIIFAIRYLLAPKYSTRKQNYVKLTKKEIDELVDDWTPEPLVAPLTELEQDQIDKTPIITGPQGPKVKLVTGKTVTNLAAYNFFNFASAPALTENAISTLRAYGVGPCGPPGFYGTQDVHIELEKDISIFLGVEACICYSQAVITIGSVIPAFCKRGDVIVADKKCNYAIQKGLQISRSTIRWYEHNNMDDLVRVLNQVQAEFRGRPLTRRFIVTEAVFEDGGDITDLPTIIELKRKFKYRLILDETLSFGILGDTGRGLTEYHDVPPTAVDAIVGSLATTFAGGGGFCAGAEEIVCHQRITGSAYVFSAALPAMLATTASMTIKLLRDNPDHYLIPLRENIKTFHSAVTAKTDLLSVISSPLNPIVTIVLNLKTIMTVNDEEKLLQDIVDECLANNLLVTRIKRIPAPPGDRNEAGWFAWQPRLGFRAAMTIGLTKKETEKAAGVVRSAVVKVIGKKR